MPRRKRGLDPNPGGRDGWEDRCKRVKAAWERIEDAEPDISTERLMAMVANDTGEDYGDLASMVAD
jgi:hypothetical protein